MKKYLNPKLLFIINTLPTAGLFIFYFNQFNVIKSLLSRENIRYWMFLYLVLIILGALNIAYAVYLIIKKKSISFVYAIIALFCYILFIYLFIFNFRNFIPFIIPQFMVSLNIIYELTFIMPTIIYSIFILADFFTHESKEHNGLISMLIAIGIPISFFLIEKFIVPVRVWQFNNSYVIHLIVFVFIAATVFSLFFLIRSLIVFIRKKSNNFIEFKLVWKIPVCIVLPVTGLLVNNKLEIGQIADFNNIWFYILAVLNGVFICLPNLEKKVYRFILFAGRSISFAYTLYFFMVFLPFLPFSILAIFIMGAGILMVTPLLLFAVHISILYNDYRYLITWLSKKTIIIAALISFMIIPECITIVFLKDKVNLNNALEYLYAPDYTKQYNINKKSIKKSIEAVKHHKGTSEDIIDIFFTTPYISSYFKFVVFNNLTLSDVKIRQIENVFFGESLTRTGRMRTVRKNVEITNLIVNSNYDNLQNVWISRIDMEITNNNNFDSVEYVTGILLPEGCWISDYYLYVDDEKKYGILAERRAAMWLYYNIVNVEKDPGILFYTKGNKVDFRIFPFSANETRKTGIEFIHKEPVSLIIDDEREVFLGSYEYICEDIIETENYIYISGFYKQTLNTVQRKPYFHFLIDASGSSKENYRDYLTRVQTLINSNKQIVENAHISLVNSYIKTFPLTEDWQIIVNKEIDKQKPLEGGFFLDRAFEITQFNAFHNNTYPVFIVVSDNLDSAVFDRDFSNFDFASPEGVMWFYLTGEGQLYSTYQEEEYTIKDIYYVAGKDVFEYRHSDNSISYLPINYSPSIILKNDIFDINEENIKQKDWQTALALRAKQISHTLYPKIADKEWKDMVKYSFMSGIMTPVTSFIVVENKAQEEILKKKQEQAIFGGKLLDMGEEALLMNEPDILFIAVLFCLIVGYKKRNKRLFKRENLLE